MVEALPPPTPDEADGSGNSSGSNAQGAQGDKNNHPKKPFGLLSFLSGRPRHELEFLPAALEVLETPPPPLPRAILLTIGGLCFCLLLGTIVGKVDIVANAPGSIFPVGKSKRIQATITASVARVLVADGDHVEAGQPVMLLDPVNAQAARSKAQADAADTRMNVAGLRALRDALSQENPSPSQKNTTSGNARPLSFPIPAGVDPKLAARELAAITARSATQDAKMAQLFQQMEEKKAELIENKAAIDKLKAELPLLGKARVMYRKLYDEQLTSQVNFLDSERRFTDAVHDLAAQIARRSQIESERSALEKQALAQKAEYARTLYDDLATAERKLDDDEAALTSAHHNMEETALRAPASGTVQQLAVHGEREVVTPGEKLMVIVPDERRLVVEAMIPNRDIGFVHPGQAAQIKVAAFKFTQYGLVPGRVVAISREAVNDGILPEERARAQDAAKKDSGMEGAEGSGYVARIALDRESVPVEGGIAPLQPGMAVTAEIITGKRRVISYLLSPLWSHMEDSGKER